MGRDTHIQSLGSLPLMKPKTSVLCISSFLLTLLVIRDRLEVVFKCVVLEEKEIRNRNAKYQKKTSNMKQKIE